MQKLYIMFWFQKKKLRKEHDIQTAVIDNFKIIDQCVGHNF